MIEKYDIGIGTKDLEKLKPTKIEVVTFDISPPRTKEGVIVKGKDGKELKDIVTFGCKHPDKEELIEISKAKVSKNDKLVETGIWFQTDSDGKIVKNSTLAEVLRYYGSGKISELKGKKFDTITGQDGFLIIKAY